MTIPQQRLYKGVPLEECTREQLLECIAFQALEPPSRSKFS